MITHDLPLKAFSLQPIYLVPPEISIRRRGLCVAEETKDLQADRSPHDPRPPPVRGFPREG
jgi:hypothetical protein